MTKPKVTTIQQRFGFADKDLRTPEHDEILFWLDQNMGAILGRELEPDMSLTELVEYVAQSNVSLEYNAKSNQLQINVPNLQIAHKPEEPKAPPFTGSTEQFDEYTIQKQRYRDLLKIYNDAQAEKERLDHRTSLLLKYTPWIRYLWENSTAEKPTSNITINSKTWQTPVADKQYIIGFTDLHVSFDCPFPFFHLFGITRRATTFYDSFFYAKSGQTFDVQLAFQVQTTLPTAGELLRQLQMFQKYMPKDVIIVVVSPNDSYQSLLNEQRFGFLQYK